MGLSPWPSACSCWCGRCRARSACCAAPGARRSGWEASSTCSTWPPAGRPSDEEREELEILRRLASTLGAAYLQEEGDDVATTAARVAEERDTTYVLMGQPRPARGLRRFGGSLPERLMERLPGVDVRIVAHR